jgi:hypothetical protein
VRCARAVYGPRGLRSAVCVLCSVCGCGVWSNRTDNNFIFYADVFCFFSHTILGEVPAVMSPSSGS